MAGTFALMGQRRFLPLFATQFLNAFNDNFYKMAMIVLVTFTIYKDPTYEAWFNALAGGIFILPYFLFSALAGQLADRGDKTKIIHLVKTAEIGFMLIGALGIYMHNVPIMLTALFFMGIHSSFFGPIKYAILPQHLNENEVLAGTGWVEAGTYIAILGGTIVGGLLPAEYSMIGIVIVAIIGRITAAQVPPAPAEVEAEGLKLDYNVVRSSWQLVAATMKIPRLYLAIISISFFWAIGAILAAQFPPLVKNALGGDNTVATMFTAIFSVGVSIGSIVVNRLLKGEVSAKYSPISVMIMSLFVLDLWWNVYSWTQSGSELMNWRQFLDITAGDRIIIDLLGVAIAGGMFVVPLYAFLTTTVPKSETARTVAANNIVNSAFMVGSALILSILIALKLTIADTLFLVAVMCWVSAYLATRLNKASAGANTSS